MASTINASSTGSGGLITAGDTSGVLELQVNGNTALTLNANKVVEFATSNVTKSIIETANISATAATGTINVDLLSSAVWYYTSNASSNWTFNFRGNSTTTLDSVMATGQAITVAFLVQQGSTGYYATSITIDGAANTPLWQFGSSPTSSVSNSLNVYLYTIIKTSAGVFKVLGQRSIFA